MISARQARLRDLCVQAKRSQDPSVVPEVQGFYGALAGRRAKKGVVDHNVEFHPRRDKFRQPAGGGGIVLIDAGLSPHVSIG